jgi:hypothetical protein
MASNGDDLILNFLESHSAGFNRFGIMGGNIETDHVCLSYDYFLDHDKFHRKQDIDPKYLIKSAPSMTIFLSHRWATPDDPDPDKTQFNQVRKEVLQRSKLCGYWFDYSCMPQKPRTIDDDVVFKKHLYTLNDLVLNSDTWVIPSDDYMQRSWCVSEYLMAGDLRDLGAGNNKITEDFLIFGAIISILNEGRGVALLTKMINIILGKTAVTNGGDKEIILRILISFYQKSNLRLSSKLRHMIDLVKSGNLKNVLDKWGCSELYDEFRSLSKELSGVEIKVEGFAERVKEINMGGKITGSKPFMANGRLFDNSKI